MVASVTNVSRGADGWYEIITSDGVYFAKKVIAGFGIGPHQKPTNSVQDQEVLDPGKVMDMDSYHRDLKNPYSELNRLVAERGAGSITLGISGPNAGVDAVKSATDRGMHVQWYVSGGPAIVEGMYNAITNKHLVTIHYCYLGGWTHAAGKLILTAGKVNAAPTIRGDFANGGTAAATVDFLVYAPGPDVGKVSSIFSEGIRAGLTAHEDAKADGNKHFDAPAVYNWQRSSIEGSDINIDSSIWQYIKTVGRSKRRELDTGKVFTALLGQTHAILGAYTFALPRRMHGRRPRTSRSPKDQLWPSAPPIYRLKSSAARHTGNASAREGRWNGGWSPKPCRRQSSSTTS